MSDFAEGFSGGLNGSVNLQNSWANQAALKQKMAQQAIEDTRMNKAADANVAQFGPQGADPTALNNNIIAQTNQQLQAKDSQLSLVKSLQVANSNIPDDTPPEQAQASREQAWQQVSQLLPHTGVPPQQLQQFHDQYVSGSNPHLLDILEQGLQHPDADKLAGGAQILYDPDTKKVSFAGMTQSGAIKQAEVSGGGIPTSLAVADTKATATAGGKLAQDEQWVDPNDKTKGVAPIPGSKLDIATKATAANTENKSKMQTMLSDSLLTNIDTALAQLKADKGVAGVIGSKLVGVPLVGQHQTDFDATLSAIKGGEVFRQFEAMKNASGSTGLGRLLGAELPLLQNRISAVNQAQSAGQLKTNLGTLRVFVSNLVDKVGKADATVKPDDVKAPTSSGDPIASADAKLKALGLGAP